MLLVVDVGNNADAPRHLRRGRADRALGVSPPCASRQPTSWAPRWRNLLALRGLEFGDIDASIVSSTVPQTAPGVVGDDAAAT